MIEETLTVVKSDEQSVWLAPKQVSGCSKCESGQGCGASIWAKFFPLQRKPIVLDNTVDASVGQDVIIEIAEPVLLTSAFLVYMVPLFSMFAVAVLGQWFAGQFLSSDSELWTVAFGLFGLFGGLLVVRKVTNLQFKKTYSRPVIVRVASPFDSGLFQLSE